MSSLVRAKNVRFDQDSIWAELSEGSKSIRSTRNCLRRHGDVRK